RRRRWPKPRRWREPRRGTSMNNYLTTATLCLCLASLPSAGTAQTAKGTSGIVPAAPAIKTFGSPKQAADALVIAVGNFDKPALGQMFGPTFEDVILFGEDGLDRQRAAAFAAKAKEKQRVSIDPKTGTRAFL